MSEFVYKDYLPLNARVIVNYKAREKVKFSYPVKKSYLEAVWTNAFQTVVAFWLQLHTMLLFYIGLYIYIPYTLFRTIFFPFVVKATEASILNFGVFLIETIIPLFFICLYLVGIPALVTLYLSLDKNRLSTWIPKIGYWSACLSFRIKHITFTKHEVFNKKVIIPIFHNVYLSYQCDGDFDKFLEKVEIIEIPLKFTSRNFFMPFIKKVRNNEFLFRAVFYFSQPINQGKMEVMFD